IYPDWVQVDFSGAKTIGEIDVFTLQDNTQNLEPTDTMTFSQYGITVFDAQYWDGSNWVTVPGGSILGNNKVKRTFTFSPVTTSRIRVLVSDSMSRYSRIVELEAYQYDDTVVTNTYTINVSASPSVGGVVTGGGTFASGSS